MTGVVTSIENTNHGHAQRALENIGARGDRKEMPLLRTSSLEFHVLYDQVISTTPVLFLLRIHRALIGQDPPSFNRGPIKRGPIHRMVITRGPPPTP